MNRAACLAVALTLAALPRSAWPLSGVVLDAATAKPIADAVVTSGDALVTTDRAGLFELARPSATVRVRAVGYRRAELASNGTSDEPLRVALTPFRPKALYLSFFGIGSRSLREPALALIDATELNALVIDVKGDSGRIPYASRVPLAAAVGAPSPKIVGDIRGLLARLHAKGLYTIARIVVFKDAPLAVGRPDLAVKTRTGAVWRDREHLAWTDPFRREVWEYDLDIAVEAAENGFDEIQFDYLRFPDAPDLVYAQPTTQASRVSAIVGFLAEARRRLGPYNVFLSADVFGYVCWNLNDTMIGQRLEDMVPFLDYISPMLYPSTFQFGIPGYRVPVAYPNEIVRLSLERAQRRTGLPAVRFRPWLQAFRDYAFDRRPFGGAEIRAQITAADGFGSNGWMLWNARNVYSPDGLQRRMIP